MLQNMQTPVHDRLRCTCTTRRCTACHAHVRIIRTIHACNCVQNLPCPAILLQSALSTQRSKSGTWTSSMRSSPSKFWAGPRAMMDPRNQSVKARRRGLKRASSLAVTQTAFWLSLGTQASATCLLLALLTRPSKCAPHTRPDPDFALQMQVRCKPDGAWPVSNSMRASWSCRPGT